MLDDPNTTVPTHDELLTLNAALGLRLDMTVSALLRAAYQLNNALCEVNDAEISADLCAARDMAQVAISLARGETTTIPKALRRGMSLQRQATAESLLQAALPPTIIRQG
jgi:hypothetical protein